MSIWGGITGGLLGFAVFGPIGACGGGRKKITKLFSSKPIF